MRQRNLSFPVRIRASNFSEASLHALLMLPRTWEQRFRHLRWQAWLRYCSPLLFSYGTWSTPHSLPPSTSDPYHLYWFRGWQVALLQLPLPYWVQPPSPCSNSLFHLKRVQEEQKKGGRGRTSGGCSSSLLPFDGLCHAIKWPEQGWPATLSKERAAPKGMAGAGLECIIYCYFQV